MAHPQTLGRMLSLLGALTAPLAYGEDTTTALPAVQVTEQRDTNTPQTAAETTIDAASLKEKAATNVKDLVRDEAGVSITRKPSRFGLSGYNIRGLEENRIVMQVDGIRLPDSFVFGGYSSASRDMADVALLSSVSIQRGTGSAQHGADALGGVVSYATPSPEAILDGRPQAFELGTIWQSSDDSIAYTATAAKGDSRTALMIRSVWRSAQEIETQGNVGGSGIQRTEANPQAIKGQSGIVKLALTPSTDLRSELGFEWFSRNVHTHQLSAIVGTSINMNTDDRYRRERLSLDQRLPWAWGVTDLKLYRQSSRTWQYTRDDQRYNANAAAAALKQRYFDFEQNIHGIKASTRSRFDVAGQHLALWGGEFTRTRSVEARDGYTTRRNGVVVRSVDPDVFPARDFPPSKVDQLGAFIQDEWWTSEAITLTPALRYDDYRLKPEPDSVYLSNIAAQASTPFRAQRLSPKIGAVWRVAGPYEIAAQYAHGFRPPPFNDVNIGFGNTTTGYIVVSNPKLKAETSRGVEFSLRQRGESSSWALTAFDNRYRNFIESVQLDCPSDPLCDLAYAMTFQSQNLNRVRIRGFEGSQRWTFAPRWNLRSSFAYAKGRQADGTPIYSVNPLTGTLGLGWASPSGRWKVDALTTAARRKTEADAAGSNRQFLPKDWAVLDLKLIWHFAPRSMVMAGVNNVFDQTYHLWADVPVADIHIADSRAGPARYSQPGRNFVASINLGF